MHNLPSDVQVFDCEQGTPEWLQARSGVVTASKAYDIIPRGKDAKTRRSYMCELAADLVTGGVAEKSFKGNADTLRGPQDEPIIRKMYEERNNCQVREVGFLRKGDIGCSPDGLVKGQKIGIEIKSMIGQNVAALHGFGGIDKKHMYQIQTSLMLTEYDAWDYVVYCSGMPLYIERVKPNIEIQEEIQEELVKFNQELFALVALIESRW